MLNLREVADHFGVSTQTVKSWINGGLLAAIDVSGAEGKNKQYRIEPEAVEDFIRIRGSKKVIRLTPTITTRPILQIL